MLRLIGVFSTLLFSFMAGLSYWSAHEHWDDEQGDDKATMIFCVVFFAVPALVSAYFALCG